MTEAPATTFAGGNPFVGLGQRMPQPGDIDVPVKRKATTAPARAASPPREPRAVPKSPSVDPASLRIVDLPAPEAMFNRRRVGKYEAIFTALQPGKALEAPAGIDTIEIGKALRSWLRSRRREDKVRVITNAGNGVGLICLLAAPPADGMPASTPAAPAKSASKSSASSPRK